MHRIARHTRSMARLLRAAGSAAKKLLRRGEWGLSMPDYDILIVGGGLNGASLAYGLASQCRGIRIGLIETRELQACVDVETDYDARSIALAYASQLIYQNLGLWESLQVHTTPIEEVYVSERGRFGSVCFRSADLGIPALGYVLPAVTLQQVLNNALHKLSEKGAVDLICPATLTAISRSTESMTVEYLLKQSTQSVTTALLIGADGADSAVRRLAHIPTSSQDYEQMAIVAQMGLACAHRGVAYERFTPEGILALLPLLGTADIPHRSTLIWTASLGQAEDLLALTDQAYLSHVQELWDDGFVHLKAIGQRYAIPLRKIRALDPLQTRLVLVGNAAHSLHPVAAQGLNLGLRDVAVLLEVILEAYATGGAARYDLGSFEVLQTYIERRGRDQQQIMGFVEGLIKLFGKQNAWLSRCRGLALQLLDMSPSGKYYLARLPLGIAGRASKLISGVPL